jgi:AcrR family transcriptional regulator
MTSGQLEMPTPKKQRATKADQKQERRQAILDMAWEMFKASSYAEVTMADVAERLTLAKGTVFLYFSTKEELFLAVQAQQLELWFDAIDAKLGKLPQSQSVEPLVQMMAQSLKRNPHFVGLLAILGTVLEQNIALESALRFKRMLLRRLGETGALIETHLPWLQAGEGALVLMRMQALVVGLWHQADTSAVVTEALREKDLRKLAVDFQREFQISLAALLRGMAATEK